MILPNLLMTFGIATVLLGGAFIGFTQATEPFKEVPMSPEKVCPLPIGSTIPKLTLKTVAGASFDLTETIETKSTILIFYRGSWCPYCNLQLSQLQKLEPELLRLGYQILAISPDLPEKLRGSTEKNALSYTLLSDSKMEGARAFGVAFKVDDKTLAQYKTYGIDLEQDSGERHHLLPVPSVFVFGKNGLIKFFYVNPDYTVRLDPDVLLAAAKAALK